MTTTSNLVIDVPKLEDAELAGGARASECTLIITEGDSAKALAVAGLSVVGRERYGVYPLRGKPLNVRDASLRKVGDNAELTGLMRALGLKVGNGYAASPVLASERVDGAEDGQREPVQQERARQAADEALDFARLGPSSPLEIPNPLAELVEPPNRPLCARRMFRSKR